jgi:hypothetical protein
LKAAWVTRRANETARLIDRLIDAGDGAEALYNALTGREQWMVDA